MPKSTKKNNSGLKNENLYWLLGSLAAGAALVLITGNGSGETGTGDDNAPKPGGTTLPEDTSAPSPTADNIKKEHVFIDSWNGETLYENYNDSFFNPFPWADPIVTVENRRYIGKLTGRKHEIMREVTGIVEGTQRKYWVDENEVEIVTEKRKNELLNFGNGKQMHPYVTGKIDKYFKTKYYGTV